VSEWQIDRKKETVYWGGFPTSLGIVFWRGDAGEVLGINNFTYLTKIVFY